MTRLALALAGALSAGVWGCEDVPTLTFAPDAAPDAILDAADAGAALPADATAEGGCPGVSPPQAAFVCCGPVMCEGQCAGQCNVCMSKCTSPGDFCCAQTNNVVCRPAGAVCK